MLLKNIILKVLEIGAKIVSIDNQAVQIFLCQIVHPRYNPYNMKPVTQTFQCPAHPSAMLVTISMSQSNIAIQMVAKHVTTIRVTILCE